MAAAEDLLFEVRMGEPWGTNAKLLLQSKLGLLKAESGTRFDQLTSAKVLIFTGHHFVRHGEPPGSFHQMDAHGFADKNTGIDLSKVMRERKDGKWQDATSDNAKLIIMSGCYTLTAKPAEYFHTTFPKSVALGFAGSSALKKGKFYETFLESIPGVLDVDDESHVVTIVKTWIAHIEKASVDKTLWEGGSADPTLRKPGYMLADGKVHIWSSVSRSWT